ncbi:hypothetical protein [Phenylobacterium montanum]|uniref:Uncharacterized protein n=1 Tax=Phenylobacterium montanum TaxID=2823693 RepID=A0A975IXB1_9CAUL|nr:hypothetical protein [Caulobacter sp. S6]QUD90947.1 hypothetical protein KCG34_25660 [Caulobacter sp. S6]
MSMSLSGPDFDIEIVRSTTKRDLREMGPKGWYWEDSRMAAVGPFDTPLAAIQNFAAQFESGEFAQKIAVAKAEFARLRAERLARDGSRPAD